MHSETSRNLGGRPPLPDDLRMNSIGALRLRPAMLDEIDAIVTDRLAVGANRATVIRELLADALERRKGRKS